LLNISHPSKAEINYSFTVEEVVKGYEDAGACGISVLTDGKYFGGSLMIYFWQEPQ
jgi:indole-3-glycerol phosphate synthase